jgi:hypothetical protein
MYQINQINQSSDNVVIAREARPKQSPSQKKAFIVRDCFAALAMTAWRGVFVANVPVRIIRIKKIIKCIR